MKHMKGSPRQFGWAAAWLQDGSDDQRHQKGKALSLILKAERVSVSQIQIYYVLLFSNDLYIIPDTGTVTSIDANFDKLGGKKNLSNTFLLSACDWISPLCHYSHCQCSCSDVLKAIWFQNNIWKGLSVNLLFFLHCARIFVTVKQSQSQANPNLFLVKILHSFFPPIL